MSFMHSPVHDFLESVAAKTPTPGGGAVASITAALAAALGRMVLGYSLGKKALAAHDALHHEAMAELTRLGERSLQLAEDDAKAYARLNELWKLDKSDARRIAEFPDAVEAAIHAPHAVLHTSMEMLRLMQRLAPPGTTNAMLKSDLAIAAILAEAAARAAAWNVRINLPLLDDDAVQREMTRTMTQSLEAARSICAAIELACA